MVFVLGYLYLRRADKVYDPLAAKVTANHHGFIGTSPIAEHGADEPTSASLSSRDRVGSYTTKAPRLQGFRT